MIRIAITSLFLIVAIADNCAQYSSICITQDTFQYTVGQSRSINDMKTVRINYHFMLKSDGSGNFTETDDGDGRTSYNGYLYAHDLTNWMNGTCSWNEKMNIPTGNSTPVISKNYRFVLDAVYFWRNDNTYNFETIDYHNQGRDKDSVLNIFLSYDSTSTQAGGYASRLDPGSKEKYTENRSYWQGYKSNIANGYPFAWFLHGTGANTTHELGHLLGLSHTVRWNTAPPCPTGCNDPNNPGYGPINSNCDDGCNDTPAAWDITTNGGCSDHPACGWMGGNQPKCSNNLMDYTGQNALTPCQINIIHANVEGGMRSYLSCSALTKDKVYCDIGYPKVSYFGKSLSIGCHTTQATISANESIQLVYSESVSLNNFEVDESAELEITYESVCSF